MSVYLDMEYISKSTPTQIKEGRLKVLYKTIFEPHIVRRLLTKVTCSLIFQPGG